ncbi:MAG: winged helix-turn-helix transcriptional regulator, partial [Nitrospirae bacterium]|nr:winged helix-turn-helix transcriptional regulator [Nitrospirota bacterium]
MEKTFNALSEATRLELFLIINAFPDLCLCNLEYCFNLSISNLSRHLKELDSVGLIQSYKKGKWKHYRVTDYGLLFISFINTIIDEPTKIKLEQNIHLMEG